MSKKDDSKKGVGPAYPMQPTAPYAVMQGPQLHPSGAPPTYSMMHQTMQPPGHYQEQPMQPYITGGSVPQAPQVYPQQTQPYPMQNYPYPPQMHTYAYGPPLGTSYMPAQTQTVFVPGLFDAGARFDAGASPSIPPPPAWSSS
ncbi:DAZ-associated protein 2-like [Pomacea canaliculata]|uniref:DAZ-associated protein 2-like n=1 Tax=Pomacea canaliculata TaxID=400727 RepID=UPI000D7310B3|nr:DAZ-associated protein 2-like [Pomacea canaliculata]